MAIFPAPQEDYDGERVRALLGQEGVPDAMLRPARPPHLANTTLAADIGGRRQLVFRFARYDVPPVGYKAGIRLADIHRRLRQTLVDLTCGDISEEAALQARRDLMDDAVKVFPKLVRPKGRLHRLLWRLLPNPFGVASDEEVMQLLGFFLASRMTSSVHQLPTPERPSPRTRSTT